jgi:hypothetical protein
VTKPFKHWTVQPHGELVPVGEDILTVVGEIHMPIGDFPRRMTVVRLKDRRLIIYSAIALDEVEMQKLEEFGEPTFLVVPSERHRLDAPGFKERYPELKVIAPPGACEKINEVVPVDATIADFGDGNVSWIVVPGTKETEAALEVTGKDGLTLIVNEIIGSIHGAEGLKGWLLRKMGFAGDEPQVPAPVKMQFAKGREELAGQLRRWAAIPDLQRIIVSHGDIIETDPNGVLTKLAESLD